MTTSRQLLRRTLSWLFVGPRHFWLCFAVCMAALSFALRHGVSEPTVRLVGLALQVCGSVTVVWGIVETMQFFALQPPLTAFRRWLNRCPLLKKPVIGAVGAATMSSMAMSARGFTSWPIDATAPVEVRISTLERNLLLIQERISAVQAEYDRTTQALQDRIKSEEQLRLALSQQLHSTLKSYGTGGLHISAIGAVWLLLGAILGAASPEIAAFMK